MTRPRPSDGVWRDDWNTPEPVLAPIRRAGVIALDPCWNPTAITRPRVRWSVSDDGLTQPWAPHVGEGEFVFANPPYSQLAQWLTKCADEARSVAEYGGAIIALVPARVEQSPWDDIVRSTAFIAFWRGRIEFNRPDSEETTSAPFPSALLVWGPDVGCYRGRHFRDLPTAKLYRELAGHAWCAEALP